jgi:hypothetical protein
MNDSNVVDEGWVRVRMEYARWWYATHDADDKAWNYFEHNNGDDLMDFIDGMKTLRTFGPNPREWGATPETVEEYFKSHAEW